MIYIYDVTLNFNDVLYDFFEWNISDSLLHIRKIPIIKINTDDLKNIINNEIKISDNEFNKIKGKTEIYGKKNKMLNCCLFRNDDNIIAVKFDDNGKAIKISSLIVEEELDILEININNIKNFNYDILKPRKYFVTTRNERKNKNYLMKKLNNLNINNDSEKIKYLYFEYFGNMIDNPNKALTELKKAINNKIFDENIRNLLKLSINSN